MKKFLMVALLFCGIISGFAQSKGRLRIGPTGGVTFANICTIGADMHVGYHVGVACDFGITKKCYLASGVQLEQKGCEYELVDLVSIKATCTPTYLVVPLHIGWTHEARKHVRFFGDAGPFFACGIGGKIEGMSVNHKLDENFFDHEYTRRFDWGLGCRIGVGFGMFQIYASVDGGLKDVFNAEALEDNSPNNVSFNIGASVMF